MTQAEKIALLNEWKDRIAESDQIITDCLEPLMLSNDHAQSR